MGNPGQQRHLMSTELMDGVAATVAQERAMERGPTFLPHGCHLYKCEAGWESNMIRRDKGVVSCETLLELEAALKDAEAKVLFIPMNAIIADEALEKVILRNGVTKTLFKEIKGTT